MVSPSEIQRVDVLVGIEIPTTPFVSAIACDANIEMPSATDAIRVVIFFTEFLPWLIVRSQLLPATAHCKNRRLHEPRLIRGES